jgi:hypothetical protein
MLRYEESNRNGNIVVEVFDGTRKRWEFIGTWGAEDKAAVEQILKDYNSPLLHHWQLYDGTWGNMFRFVAKWSSWEQGHYCVGDTATELAQSITVFYETGKRGKP